MLGVLGEDGAQVPFASDEKSVGAFGAGGAYPPLREGVRPRALRRRRDDLGVVAGEDGVEGGSELGIAIPDEEPEATGSFSQIHQQIPGELRHPLAARMGGDAEEVDAPGLDLHDEEDVQPLEEDGVHVHEAAGQEGVGLRAKEGAPGLLGGAGGRPDLLRIRRMVAAETR